MKIVYAIFVLLIISLQPFARLFAGSQGLLSQLYQYNFY